MGINDDIADDLIERSIRIERLKEAGVAAVLARLRELGADLTGIIGKVEPSEAARPTARASRTARTIAEGELVIQQSYTEINFETQKTLRPIAKSESKAALEAINGQLSVNIANVPLDAQQINQMIRTDLIGGELLRDWWKTQGQDTQDAFGRTIRQGVQNGETTQQLIQRVRGTRAAGFKDGIMSTSANKAESLVRTAVQSTTQGSRLLTYQENDDVIKQIQQLSVLDARTSEICMAYSGKRWTNPGLKPVGHSLPYNDGPPRHFNCRSSIVPVTFSWNELANKPIATESGGTSKGIDNQFERELKQQGLSQEQIDRVVRNSQASMDGQVPEDLTYEQWLRTKSETFQRDVLGEGKWKLWNDDKISFGDLVSQRGRPLTLEQLEAKV